jgi:hypothetical protein
LLLGDGVGLTEVSLAVPAKKLWLAGDSSSAKKELQLDILLARQTCMVSHWNE